MPPATSWWRTAATSPCCWRRSGRSFYGSPVGAGDIGVVVGGRGVRAVSRRRAARQRPTAELNDPRGLAVGPTGALFVTDGFMHVIRVVPAVAKPCSAGP